jgi:hypothetical protein
MDFEFTLETHDEETYEIAFSFVNEINAEWPGGSITFDPPQQRPIGRFSVIGTMYLVVGDDPVEDSASATLVHTLLKHDPGKKFAWPPATFRAKRARPLHPG